MGNNLLEVDKTVFKSYIMNKDFYNSEREREDMVKIFLVRHGETENNIGRKMQGWCDSPLTENGIQQARQVGKELSGIQFEAAYSGDLPRQKKTAEIILGMNTTSYVPGLKTDPRFRETSFGSFEGMDIDEVYKAVGRYHGLGEDLLLLKRSDYTRKEISKMVAEADPESRAESGEDTCRRFMEGILDAARDAEAALYEDRDPEVLIISSGSAMGILLEELDPDNEFPHMVHNGDYAVIEVNRGKAVLKELNAKR